MSVRYFFHDDDFLSIIKSLIPNAQHITKLTNAWTNFVYKVSDGQDQYIFRFPRNDFFSRAMEKEIDFNQWIIPKVSFQTNRLEKHFYHGKIFSVHKAIPGNNLSEVYDKLSPKQVNKLCLDICRAIKELQSLNFHSFPLDNLSDFLARLSTVNHGNYDFSKLGILKDLENSHKCLCHGDLNPGNLIIRNGKLVAIIDFAFVSTSSNLIDISRIIGRLPDNYKIALKDNFERVFDKKVDNGKLQYLVSLWNYVEQDYMQYIKREASDIVLPDFFD